VLSAVAEGIDARGLDHQSNARDKASNERKRSLNRASIQNLQPYRKAPPKVEGTEVIVSARRLRTKIRGESLT
jgi:hypothetical protein